MRTVEELEDRIAELEDELGARPPFSMRLLLGTVDWPKACDPLLGLLRVRDQVSREAAFTVIYGGRSEGEQPNPKIIDVMMSKMRAALRPHGISIETNWGIGYFITPANKVALRALIDRLTAQPIAPTPRLVKSRWSGKPVTKKRKLEALERRRGWQRSREI